MSPTVADRAPSESISRDLTYIGSLLSYADITQTKTVTRTALSLEDIGMLTLSGPCHGKQEQINLCMNNVL